MTPILRYVSALMIMGVLAGQVHADALCVENPRLKVNNKVQLRVWAFDLRDVRLLDGPFGHAQDLDKAYLLSLDVDRLLHTFRLNAGLPSTAQPLGGWEEPRGELRGHFAGHYLSGCSLMYASTGDERLKAKADAVVKGLAECQAKLGSGYLSAYPETFFDRVEARQRVWAPYYTLHKIYAGLLDAYVYCDNGQALEVCKRFADWVIARNARLTDEQMQAMLGEEHGGMNEALANLYGLTGDERYLRVALRFNHQAVIGPAMLREDRLTGLHANTQFPKFIGAAREYELTGDPSLYTAASFFWDTVANERSYVIGGNSDGERFPPKERMSLALGTNTTETCNTYNMLKLTRHLLCLDPKAAYGDFYERALVNHILASQNPQDGMMCYYVPLRSGMTRGGAGNGYCTPLNSFWCCTGTGVENHAKYGDSIYFHDEKTLYVNLFIASELDWRAKGLKVRQETVYPEQASTHLSFTCQAPVDLALHIRHPWWAAKGVQVLVNGQAQQSPSTPGSWAVVERTWKTGDTVEVLMPFALRTEGFKDNPNRFAFLNGPVVLCAGVDTSGPFPAVVADEARMMAAIQPLTGRPNTFIGSEEVFRVPGGAGVRVTLEPFYKMHGDRPYMVYFDRIDP
ncbi:MAG: glycoside hydrolase family 127 protein [Phycisphaerae bacterium]|nr:glycoside hydrolase family 127 protein [Phycisphaerae bacterium]